MTLNEKFKKEGFSNFDYLAKVADDYAIEFAEWLNTDWTTDERWTIIVDEKELLEIFKKEKGL